MPIYEYQCNNCGHRFEAIQKVSDRPLTKCEKCKGKAERIVSSPAIQFKGSGWYVTDYARKDSGSAAKSDDSEPSKKTDDKSKKKADKASSTK